MTTVRIEGKVHTWSLDKDGKDARRYAVVTLPYGEAVKAFKPDQYNHQSGKGEQRAEIRPHIRKLRQAILEGNYTPTTVSVGLRPRHQKLMSVSDDGFLSIEVDPRDPLPHTDGQQRFAAVREIIVAAQNDGDQDLVDRALALPVTATVHIDGAPQRDFLNLQLGKSVDATHMLALKIRQDLVGPAYAGLKSAMDIAGHLHRSPESPFYRMIKFDSGSKAPVPLSSLAAKGASDLASSLVGLSSVGEAYKPEELAAAVTAAFKAVQASAPELLEKGGQLCPPPEGTKGSASLLVGLGIGATYLMSLGGSKEPSKKDLSLLVDAVRNTFGADNGGGMSSQAKRALLREFFSELTAGLAVEKHEGVPIDLVRALAPSALALGPLPKAT